MHLCKHLNERVRRIGEENRKSLKGVSETKKTKKYKNRLNVITQFMIELLLPFTRCRKVLGKAPENTVEQKHVVIDRSKACTYQK